MSFFDFFSGKKMLKETGLLAGFIDCHTHLLPGVDDGISEECDTLELLAMMEDAGVAECWFTPHIMEDIPNKTIELRQKFEALKKEYKGSITLNLAAEYMLDNLFTERLEANDFLFHRKKHLLVECSCVVEPYGFENKLNSIKSRGYYPLLAHPERYMFLDKEKYEVLREKGVKFQLNLTSLLGLYGPLVKMKAEDLLEKGMYECVGTDTHRVDKWAEMLDQSLKKKHIDMLNMLMKK